MNCPHWTLQSQESHFLGTLFAVRRMEAHRDPGQVGVPGGAGQQTRSPPTSSPPSLRMSTGLLVPNLTGLVAAMLEFPFLIITAFL